MALRKVRVRGGLVRTVTARWPRDNSSRAIKRTLDSVGAKTATVGTTVPLPVPTKPQMTGALVSLAIPPWLGAPTAPSANTTASDSPSGSAPGCGCSCKRLIASATPRTSPIGVEKCRWVTAASIGAAGSGAAASPTAARRLWMTGARSDPIAFATPGPLR